MIEKVIAAWVTIGTALFFSAGYGFLFGFYQFFDVGIWELSFSVQDIFVHSGSVVSRAISSHYILILAVFLAGGIAMRASGEELDLTAGLKFLVVPTSITLVSSMVFLSVRYGAELAQQELTRMNTVSFERDTNQVLLEFFGETKDELRFLHLVTGNDYIIVVGIFSDGGRDRWIIRIPRKEGIVSFVYQDPQR